MLCAHCCALTAVRSLLCGLCSVQARDELSNPRLNGGDDFRVLLVPTTTPKGTDLDVTTPLLPTAPAAAMNMNSRSAAMNMHTQSAAMNMHAQSTHTSATTQGMPTGPSGLSSHQLLGWSGSSSRSNGRSDGSSVDAVSLQSGDTTSSSSSSEASVGIEAYLPKPDRTQGTWEYYMGPSLGPHSAKAGGASGVLEAVAAGEVQDNGDGTYSCCYTHTVAGSYYLHVTNGKQP